MNLTKFDHSGFYIEKNGRGLLFDPVEYTHALPELDNIDIIIITHKHGDHFQPEIVNKILAKNPSAKIYTTEDNLDNAKSSLNSENIFAVKPGMQFEVSEFQIDFFGSGNHASIMNGKIPCQNIGTVIDNRIVNPGDSFDASSLENIDTLLVPISAPWLKTEESVKYIETLQPKTVINTHDGLLSEMGLNITGNWISQKSSAIGAEYKFLEPGASFEIPENGD